MVLPSGRDLSRPEDEVTWRVRGTSRERLDLTLLRELGWGSRTKVQRLIDLGLVHVNGRPGKRSQRLLAGDVVRVRLDAGRSVREEHPPLEPPLWEDPHLLAVAKPPGRLVHPTGRTLSGTVIDELHARYRELNERGGRPIVPRLCHRLDRDTSGLLLIAKTPEARRAVQEAFEADRVRKGYLAVIVGEDAPAEFEVDAAIASHLDRSRPHSNRLARLDDSGRASRTRFAVLARGGGIAIVHCLPITGRQNQIRIHLASVGRPILGDVGYGGAETLEGASLALPPPGRTLLHSHQLRFRHPVWGTERELRAPLPADLRPYLLAARLDESRIPSLPPLPDEESPPVRRNRPPRVRFPRGPSPPP